MSRKEIYAAKTLEALQELERRKGYKFGWALKVYNARLGRKK